LSKEHYKRIERDTGPKIYFNKTNHIADLTGTRNKDCHSQLFIYIYTHEGRRRAYLEGIIVTRISPSNATDLSESYQLQPLAGKRTLCCVLYMDCIRPGTRCSQFPPLSSHYPITIFLNNAKEDYGEEGMRAYVFLIYSSSFNSFQVPCTQKDLIFEPRISISVSRTSRPRVQTQALDKQQARMILMNHLERS